MRTREELYRKLRPFLGVVEYQEGGGRILRTGEGVFSVVWNPKKGRDLSFEEFCSTYYGESFQGSVNET